MNKRLVVCAVLLPSLGVAQSAFQGTWRPDPQKADPSRKPDSVALIDGTYECRSCSPPYKIEADGRDHPVAGNRYYDTVSITVVDPHTLLKSAKQGGQQVAITKDVISADGATLTETQTVIGMEPRPIELTSTSTRVTAADAGAHAISGEWRLIQTDLTRHEEDTTYKVRGNSLMMSDLLGRSFSASLDGIDAPYLGDPKYSSVSLKMIDSKTIEETDKKDGKVVQINRWSVDPDGRTMHARFEDGQGQVQEQVGHKLP